MLVAEVLYRRFEFEFEVLMPCVLAAVAGSETLTILFALAAVIAFLCSQQASFVNGSNYRVDSGSVASPYRETEAMKDGSDAVSDWPLLNALLNTASGATWVSLHHGGGVGMGFSQHSGMVICCDGSEDADRRIERVLWNDPATGVMRHADAGYDIALDCAKEHGLNLPGILG